MFANKSNKLSSTLNSVTPSPVAANSSSSSRNNGIDNTRSFALFDNNFDDADMFSPLPEVFLSLCYSDGKLGASYYDTQEYIIWTLYDIPETPVEMLMLKLLLGQVLPTTVLAAGKQSENVLQVLHSTCQVQGGADRAGPRSSTEVGDSVGGGTKPTLVLLSSNEFNIEVAKGRIENFMSSVFQQLTTEGLEDSNSSGATSLDWLDGILQRQEGDGADCSDGSSGAALLSRAQGGGKRKKLLTGESDEAMDEIKGKQPWMVFDQKAEAMIRSLGALLRYLKARDLGTDLDEFSMACKVIAVQTFALSECMTIDVETIKALRITAKQQHPSVYKAGGGFKEGLSLYSICNKCQSRPGSQELCRWLLRPLSNHVQINARHEAVAYFTAERTLELSQLMQSHIKGVQQLNGILMRMRSSQTSYHDWSALYKSLFNMVCVGDLLRKHSTHVPLLAEMIDVFTDDLLRLSVLISKIVLFDEMDSDHPFVVRRGVDPHLDSRKQLLSCLPQLLTDFAREEVNHLDGLVKTLVIIYLPMVGYSIGIPKELDLDWTSLPGLEFAFGCGEMMHFKNETTRQLDAKFGDVRLEINDRESTVKLRLQLIIVEHTQLILQAVKCVAQIDCLIALARVANDNLYNRPEMIDEDLIEIVDGRHPLQECCTNPFVSNSTLFANADHQVRMRLITGPNASGKSVYLKQVALIVYMAHVGSFVPASVCRLGPIDRIMTRVYSQDSIREGMSTFALDVLQMGRIIREATNKTLVVIDEFGKGTSPEVGVALLQSTLEWWLQDASKCPYLLISTHFCAMVALLPHSRLLKCQMMETMRDERHNLVFLYRLVDGVSTCSFAAHTAAQAGLPDQVVDRATEIFHQISHGDLTVPPPNADDMQMLLKDDRLVRIAAALLAFPLDDEDIDPFVLVDCTRQFFVDEEAAETSRDGEVAMQNDENHQPQAPQKQQLGGCFRQMSTTPSSSTDLDSVDPDVSNRSVISVPPPDGDCSSADLASDQRRCWTN